MKDGFDRTIRVLRMGRSTCERLNAAPREAGEVHSAYARTLNLLWHAGRLLTLHGPGPLLAPFAADWRWMEKRADSPWYPTLRLFRQPKLGDWASVVESVRCALAGMLNC